MTPFPPPRRTSQNMLLAESPAGEGARPRESSRERIGVESAVTTAKLMVVDDEPINIKVVQKFLQRAGYARFVAVQDSTEAIRTFYQETPDLLLLDIMMPQVSGLDILRAVRADPAYARLPVVVLTASDDVGLKSEALELGATDFLMKPVDPAELAPRVRNALLVKFHQDHLEAEVRRRTWDLERSRLEVIHCLARAAEYRDNETGRHVIRVGAFAGIIARRLGWDEERAKTIELAATLHDVGKIGIPDDVLLKPGKLTAEEFDTMRRHCGFGRNICSQMSQEEQRVFAAHASFGATIMNVSSSPILQLASRIALTHHERWDGSGYPLGLAGEDIPLEGRITAVADVYDALSSRRPYKPPFPREKCFAILEESRGTHFDPAVLDAFFLGRDEIVAVQMEHADTV